MEALDMLHRGRSKLFLDGVDLVFVHMDSLRRNYMPQEYDLGCEKVALLKVSIELFASEDAQHSMEVACMLLFISAIHEYVIKVYNNKLAYE